MLLGTLSVTNPGVGYTPADGSFTYTGVNLVAVSGNGSEALQILLLRMELPLEQLSVMLVVMVIKLVM